MNKKICERLRELRNIKKITQVNLAETGGVSRTAIGNYEKGSVTPPTDFLIAISQAYDVSMDWLCGLTDEMNGKTLTTYADLFNQIQDINAVLALFTVDIDCSEAYSAEYDTTHYYTHIRIDDKILYTAFKDYDNMCELLYQNTISQHLFDLWVKDKQNDLSDKKLPMILLKENEEWADKYIDATLKEDDTNGND